MFACSLCCSRGVCLALDSRSTVLKGRYGHWPSIFQGFETHLSFLKPCLCYGAIFRRGCSDQPSSFFPARQGFMTPEPHTVKFSRCPNCFKFSWHFRQAILCPLTRPANNVCMLFMLQQGCLSCSRFAFNSFERALRTLAQHISRN